MYKDKCGTCKHWSRPVECREIDFKAEQPEFVGDYKRPYAFDCIRYPPVAIPSRLGGSMTCWPKTYANDECGEYKPIPEPNYSYLIDMKD